MPKPLKPYSRPFPLVQAMESGNWEKAEAMLRQMVRTSPPHPDMLMDFGRALGETGQHDEAVKVLKRATKKAPGNPQVAFQTGLAAMKAKQWKDARSAFSEALKAAPGEPAILLNLATVLMELREPARAVELFETAIAQPTLDADQRLYARTLLIEAYRDSGDVDAMRREAASLAADNPKSRGAILNLLTKGTKGKVPLAAAAMFPGSA
ncbi:tetratricopeptide repeat protein [Tepidamorphus sp. 3E244]|uniref:tetratricopeptide repeat protein n=1 Tax=Tepidamorphus sp. 3E244 TaxID=3385498 RepID=UPI0038FC3EB4